LAADLLCLLLLLLLLLGEIHLGLIQVGNVHLGGELVWVAGQYHPIEERDAIGGGNGKRRRAVRRESVQRALGDSLGDAINGGGEGSLSNKQLAFRTGKPMLQTCERGKGD